MSVAFGSVAFGKLCVAGAAVAGDVATTLARSLLGFANDVDHDVMHPAVDASTAQAAIAGTMLACTRIMRIAERNRESIGHRIFVPLHRKNTGSGGQIVEESTAADKLRKQAPPQGGPQLGHRNFLYSQFRGE